MIEITIKNHLDSILDVPVSTEETTEPRYVLFSKTGGSKSDHLSTSTFAFQSYAESLYQAAVLNDQVKEAVVLLVTNDDVAGVYLNSDYNFTDTATKRYRYQAVFDIYHY